MKRPMDQKHRALLEQDIRVLIPVAKRLARRAGKGNAITVGNVKRHCKNKDVLLASKEARYRAVLFGQIMKRAGLARASDEKVTLPRDLGGNDVFQWTLPEWAPRKQTRRVA